MFQPYLDKNGLEMQPEQKPVFMREPTKAMSDTRIAKYVQCAKETVQGLIWIGHCENCEHFGGHVKYRGINCNVKQ